MTFAIEFPLSPVDWADGTRSRALRVQFGDFEERVPACLRVWTEDEYGAQWRRALRRLVDGPSVSCLVGCWEGAQALIGVYPMWRLNAAVAIQEHLLDPAEYPDFDPSTAHEHEWVRQRGVSEWMVSLAEVRAFQERLD